VTLRRLAATLFATGGLTTLLLAPAAFAATRPSPVVTATADDDPSEGRLDSQIELGVDPAGRSESAPLHSGPRG
jgi:hypothetical protein